MKEMRKQIGEYFIDISKLTFGGVVLSVILEISNDKLLVLIIGGTTTMLLAVLGLILTNKRARRK